MHAIEAARQEAERLHLAARDSGSASYNPLGLAISEAESRDIEVYAVPKGDPQLKGGRAIFDSQAWMILYEGVGSEFDKAFLISHELGHVVIEGGAEDIVTEEVDEARPSAEPLVGAARVLDYGSRERREVVMDLFAREFLVPRSIVKRCYLEEGMSSVDISELFNTPLRVVQQQLLDALLLPTSVATHSKTEKKDATPDQSQIDAASHRGSPYQLQAGPGTGKTTTLVKRIEELLNEGVDPSTILVLTFSNKAAGELRERITQKAPEAVATLWVGTFHSFGLDIIHRFHHLLGLSENPNVISKYEAIELLEDELTQLPLNHFRNLHDPTLNLADMLSAISRAKDEVVDASCYRKLSENMLEAAGIDEEKIMQAEKCIEVAALFTEYELLLKKNNAVDFGDLVSLPVSLVEANEDVGNALSKRHQHILVDEYQDVNRASVRLLKAITGEGNKLWVVGDSRQSIYRFRGASSINMKRFSSDFPDAKIEQLSVNYRSVREVVDLFSTFSTTMKASEGVLPLNLDPIRGSSGELPEFRVVKTPADEIAAIARAVVEKKEQGFEYKEQAILCTSNNRLGEIAKGFELLGIPVLYLGSLFERGEIKGLLSLLSLVVDKRATGLVRVATFLDLQLDLDEVILINQHIKGNLVSPFEWAKNIESIADLSEEGRESLKNLASILHGFSAYDDPWSILATLVIDRLEYARKIALSDNFTEQMEGIAIWQLLNFCRKKINGKGSLIERLLFRIRRLVLLSEDRDMRQLPQEAMNIKGVRLMTIHASKGLEFDVVHLPGMITTGLPSNNKPPRCLPPDLLIEGSEGLTGGEAVKAGHDEEEECKFFVAASRAKDSLMLYASSVISNGNSRKASKYIDRISSHILRRDIPSLHGLQAIPLQKISISSEGCLSITDSQLSQYERCPRRFFYTHLMSLGGARIESTYMQMSSVVYDVLAWISKNHSESTPTSADLNVQFQKSWQNKGPVEHAYAEDYESIGHRLVEFLMETREGKKLVKPEMIKVSFPSGEITILPNEVTVDQDGQRSIRRIKTGKKRSTEFDNIEYSVLINAVEQHFGHGTMVEVIHLAGETQEQVVITDRKKSTRLGKAEAALDAILSGEFPPFPDNRSCPRCPSFFICGDVPSGSIKINN